MTFEGSGEQEMAAHFAAKDQSDYCAVCKSRFSSALSGFKVPFRSASLQRNKHTCRVCCRVVCEYSGTPEGCAAMIMVHELVRHRKGPKPKKANKKETVACTACPQPCRCASEWVCKECRVFMGNVNIEAELKRFEFSLDALRCNPVETKPFSLEPDHAKWLASIDCEYAGFLEQLKI
jgi:hypothetical protein